jgi:hypothetical protein
MLDMPPMMAFGGKLRTLFAQWVATSPPDAVGRHHVVAHRAPVIVVMPGRAAPLRMERANLHR